MGVLGGGRTNGSPHRGSGASTGFSEATEPLSVITLTDVVAADELSTRQMIIRRKNVGILPTKNNLLSLGLQKTSSHDLTVLLLTSHHRSQRSNESENIIPEP
ncbi:hypothetical protein NPIL_448631 [Nephila pilipes]|uniref:Uncharacterized protein n=1 Tax=Nephila pilipes TaxID=299642 RepID=A0A8X6ING4_NEPPI|nr:hypothetical protein NPIL_448631 [Nephila pilipes]